MPNWEYQTFDIQAVTQDGQEIITWIDGTKVGKTPLFGKIQGPSLKSWLDARGNEGWELVNLQDKDPQNSLRNYLVSFKRAK